MNGKLSLLPAVERALVEWLPAQRWFGGKAGRIERVTVRPLAELLDRTEWNGPAVLLTTARVWFTTGQTHTYQLPLAVWPKDDNPAGPSTITVAAGHRVTDATADREVTAELLHLLSRGARRGPIRFTTEPAGRLAFAVHCGLQPRVLGGEQSNTSIVYGDRFILKVFRRLHDGQNPDLELQRALNRRGSTHVAPLLGTVESYVDKQRPTTLAMMHSFHGGAADGWQLATEDAARSLTGASDGGSMPAQARLLGASVATVHADLGAELGAGLLTQGDLAALRDRCRARLGEALAVVPALAPYAQRIRTVYDAVAGLRGSHVAQRVHGDLHLGQVLRTPTRWLLIDFEGEPAATVEARRTPDSPARDVAGMLRSFDYAAAHAIRESEVDNSAVELLGARWAAECRAAFLDGYGWSADPEQQTILTAYELDKAVYEAGYEAQNRPAWLPIPLAGVSRLLDVAPVAS